jgi:hypothetical protein
MAAEIEKHYRVKDLCRLLSLSDRSVRRLIADEPGVLELLTKSRRSKRPYRTVLVPESILKRLLTRLGRFR